MTGRPRRCGWFDACLVRQTRKVGGINGIALTKLDVLDQLPELKICVGYRLDGREIDYLPAAQAAQARVEPIYETMEGWTESTRGARSWAELPAQCVKYVRRLEELIERAGGAALHEPRSARTPSWCTIPSWIEPRRCSPRLAARTGYPRRWCR